MPMRDRLGPGGAARLGSKCPAQAALPGPKPQSLTIGTFDA